jgi:beta-lactamase class A
MRELLTLLMLTLTSTVRAAPTTPSTMIPYPTWPVTLQTEVGKLACRFDGEVGVYIKDLTTEAKYTYNAATPFYIASVVKLPIMITAYRMADTGQLSLNEEMVYTADDVRDGAPQLKNANIGDKLTVRQLIRHMMVNSDNGATDLLLKRVGIDNVNRMLADNFLEGFRTITPILEVRRRVLFEVDSRGWQLTPTQVYDIWKASSLTRRGAALATAMGEDKPWTYAEMDRAFSAYYASQVNSAPLDDVGMLLEALARNQLASFGATAEMLDIMQNCETGSRRLRAGLPDNITIAHKTGTQHRRACDAGIIHVTPDRAVIMAMCTKDFGDLHQAEHLIAQITQKAYTLIRGDTKEGAPTGASATAR